MSTLSTTIRVSVATPDRLAAQARQRGISVAALVTGMAAHAEREVLLRAERDAARADARIPAVAGRGARLGPHQRGRHWVSPAAANYGWSPLAPDPPASRPNTAPGVIVSVEEILTGLADELIVVIPVSSSRAGSPLRPPITPAGGVDTHRVAICRGIRAVARSRLLQQLGTTTPATMHHIQHALSPILGVAPQHHDH